jgi:hypothetical protein
MTNEKWKSRMTRTERKILDQLGARIDAAYVRAQRGHQEWVAGSLELIVALSDAREKFPSNADFGNWLASNGHDHFNDHDRAGPIQDNGK